MSDSAAWRHPFRWWRRRQQRKLDAVFALAYAKTGNRSFWDGISTIPPRPDGKSWGGDSV